MINTYLNIHSEKKLINSISIHEKHFLQSRNGRELPQSDKCIDRKPTANVILNNENSSYPPKLIRNTSILTVSIKPCTEYPSQ